MPRQRLKARTTHRPDDTTRSDTLPVVFGKTDPPPGPFKDTGVSATVSSGPSTVTRSFAAVLISKRISHPDATASGRVVAGAVPRNVPTRCGGRGDAEGEGLFAAPASSRPEQPARRATASTPAAERPLT